MYHLVVGAINWTDLHLSPIAVDLGFFQLKWYSLAYLAGIFTAYFYVSKLLDQPGSPMARRHADDLIFYASLGVIFGGRLGYVLFYNLGYYLANPLDIVKLWDGGMSFHGGVIGTSLGILYLARKNGLYWLRIHDYVACCVPPGLFFGRLANFVNHELWDWIRISRDEEIGLPDLPAETKPDPRAKDLTGHIRTQEGDGSA